MDLKQQVCAYAFMHTCSELPAELSGVITVVVGAGLIISANVYEAFLNEHV